MLAFVTPRYWRSHFSAFCRDFRAHSCPLTSEFSDGCLLSVTLMVCAGVKPLQLFLSSWLQVSLPSLWLSVGAAECHYINISLILWVVFIIFLLIPDRVGCCECCQLQQKRMQHQRPAHRMRVGMDWSYQIQPQIFRPCIWTAMHSGPALSKEKLQLQSMRSAVCFRKADACSEKAQVSCGRYFLVLILPFAQCQMPRALLLQYTANISTREPLL